MFDNIKPINPTWERRKKLIWIAIAVVVVLGPILYYEFKNWPEEQAVKRFFIALQQERYQDAYVLWKPGPSYTQQDFVSDWGKSSQYGKFDRFQITDSHARGSGVIVTVKIDNKEARIWVEKRDKSLGFPPY